MNLLQSTVFPIAFLTCMSAASDVLAVPVDLVLALDRSVSMRASDPDRTSLESAGLLVRLLDADDRVAVLAFAEDTRRLLPLTSVQQSGLLESAVDLLLGLPLDGSWTNFAAALQAAYEELVTRPPDPGRKRVLALFTDGRLTLATPKATERARAAILDDWVPRLRAAGVRVYGVAFSPESDVALLSAISSATGGIAFEAERPEDIYGAFLKLFEQSEQPLVAPIVDGQLDIDSEVDALRLFVKRDKSADPIRLTDPGQQVLTAERHPDGLIWTSTPEYDQIMIEEPRAGVWALAGGDDHASRAYVESELDLDVMVPTQVQVGAEVQLSARLLSKGMPADPRRLGEVRLEAQVEDEAGIPLERIELTPVARGWHAGSFRPDVRGLHQVRLSARGAGFERTKLCALQVTSETSPVEDVTAAGGAGAAVGVAGEERAAILVLVGANAFLVLVGVLAFLIWRRRRKVAEEDDEGSDDWRVR